MRVLIVEDDTHVARNIAKMLSEAVHRASDATHVFFRQAEFRALHRIGSAKIL